TSYFASPPAGQAPPTAASPPTAEASPMPTEVSYPTREAYPPPQGWTPEPTATPEPTPTPTTLPVPILQVQPLAAEWGTGERIAFLRDGDLWLVRPDGSAQAQVTVSGNVGTIFGWSWDNSLLLLGLSSSGYTWLDLWILSADGSSARQITQGQSITFATWSPVDLSFAYVTLEGRVYVVNLEKNTPGQLEGVSAGLQGTAWSPDGTKLAILLLPPSWQPGEFSEAVDIGVWNLQDGAITNLTNTNDDPSPITNYFPVWSVDGTKILFHSERNPNRQFWYVMDSDGSNLRHLDTVPLLAALAVIRSPVADQVVMNVGGEVWLLDFEGHMDKIAETVWPCCPYPPYSWSPDGTQLVLVEPGGKLVRLDLRTLASEMIAETGSNPVWSH
ncbi:MAG: TolB family protein, partial [Chloroflexia bacterium]